MKRNISDMLNDLIIEDIRLNNTPPLSSRNIRERTMERVGITRKMRTKRMFSKVALIAAVLMSLLISACTADTVLNESRLFGGFFGWNLSDKQLGILDAIGRIFDESVTSNGTTITLLQAVSDEDTLYVHLRVEAPKGVVLGDLDEEEGYYYDFASKNGWVIPLKVWDPRQEEWVGISNNHQTTALKDEDPTDNVKEFVIRLHADYDGNAILNGPGEKVMTLKHLYIYKHYDHYQQKVMDFNISFDITLDDQNRDDHKIELHTKDLSFHNEEYNYTTTVKKVTITPLRLVLDCSSTQPNDKYIFPHGGPVEVVMKDGTKIHVLDSYYDARNYPRPDDVAGAWTYAFFEQPVVVQDIDYLIFGDDVIVDVN